MSELVNKALKFASLDLEAYLDDTIPRYERFLLENERHNISRIEHEIDTELFKTFLLNSNHLLGILNIYEKSYKMATRLVDLSKDLQRLRLAGEEEDENLVDRELVKRFRRVLDRFSSNTDVFATDGRYLVHFDILEDMEGNKHILVLANDILLIGKVQEGTGEYSLVNAYSYTIMHVEMEDEVLRVRVDPEGYVFRKDRAAVSNILRIFQELTYRYEKESEEQASSTSDNNLMDYLLFTENYECIERMGLHSPKKMFYSRKELEGYLGVLARLGQDISQQAYSFLETRFAAGLARINKVQTLDGLIEEVFRYFVAFFHEQNALVKELGSVGQIRRSGMTLLVERELKRCFEMLESRVFGRNYELKCLDSSLELIKQKLRFCKCDFSYLFDYFMGRKDRYRERCLETAMKDIERILQDMVCSDSKSV